MNANTFDKKGVRLQSHKTGREYDKEVGPSLKDQKHSMRS